MPIQRQEEVSYQRFEDDVLNVLRRDPAHRLDFSDGLTFVSTRLKCRLNAVNVHYDEDAGEVVLVGACSADGIVWDASGGHPTPGCYVSLPLRECLEELRGSAPQRRRLLDKVREACIERYAERYMRVLSSKGYVRDGVLDLAVLGLREPVGFGSSRVDRIVRHGSGRLVLCVASDLSGASDAMPDYGGIPGCVEGHVLPTSPTVSYTDLQDVAFGLDRLLALDEVAAKAYAGRMRELEPVSCTLSGREDDGHRRAALVAVYDTGVPQGVCDAVARRMAMSDAFDPRLHVPQEVAARVESWRGEGWAPRAAVRRPSGRL